MSEASERQHQRIRPNGQYFADLTADEIDRQFAANLKLIRQQARETDLKLTTGGSSLTQIHGIPRWLKS